MKRKKEKCFYYTKEGNCIDKIRRRKKCQVENCNKTCSVECEIEGCNMYIGFADAFKKLDIK